MTAARTAELGPSPPAGLGDNREGVRERVIERLKRLTAASGDGAAPPAEAVALTATG